MIQSHEIKEIIEIGMRAISTCNNQPWRFRICAEELHLFILRTKNFFLKLEGNTWIELGTMLENLSIGALSKGYKIEYRLFERCGLDEPAAIIKFIPGSFGPVDLKPVLDRCTNRALYSQTPLAESVCENILKCNEFADIAIRILSGRQKTRCAKILNNLENVRMGNRIMVEEVLPYLRLDARDVEIHRDRLDVRAMELEPAAIKVLHFAKKNTKMVSLLYSLCGKLGLRRKSEFEKTVINSGAMIAFLLERRDQTTYVNLGRVAQRILNYLTSQKIQTYTIVSGLYLLDLLKENLEIYSKKEQLLLLRYQYDLQALFDFPDSRIALFIRAGYADPPKFRTLRKHVNEVLINAHGDKI